MRATRISDNIAPEAELVGKGARYLVSGEDVIRSHGIERVCLAILSPGKSVWSQFMRGSINAPASAETQVGFSWFRSLRTLHAIDRLIAIEAAV